MKIVEFAFITEDGPRVVPFKFGERVKVKTNNVVFPTVIGFRITYASGYALLLQWDEGDKIKERWVDDCWIEKLAS